VGIDVDAGGTAGGGIVGIAAPMSREVWMLRWDSRSLRQIDVDKEGRGECVPLCKGYDDYGSGVEIMPDGLAPW
jgi:hypothetical protein